MHVGIIVIPQRHDENHAAVREGIAHGLDTTLFRKVVGVAEDGLLVLAEVIVDCVAADTCDVACRLIEDLATLNVLATDLDKVAAVSVIGGDKLGHNGERLRGVDRLARAVERGVAHAEGVEVAAVPVAVAAVSVAITRSTSCVGGAGGVAGYTRVRSDRVGNFVGFSDVSRMFSKLQG